MKLTQSEVFSLIEALKPTQTTHPDYNSLSSGVADVLRVPVTNEIRDICKKQLLAFKRFKKGSQNNASWGRENECDGIVFDDEDYLTVENVTDDSATQKKYKSFLDLGDQMRKLRTKDVVNVLKKFVTDECSEISLNQLLGYILYRENKQTNKTLKDVGNLIFENKIVESNNEFSVNEGIALKHFLNLSKFQMRSLRYMFNHKEISFPTTNELREARKKLRPTISPSLNNKGVYVDYRELVQMTVKSVLKLVEVQHDFEHFAGDTFTIFFKDGCDGAGQQVVMKSTSMIDAKDNMFLYGLVVLKLVCKRENGEEIVLWQNKTPNSSGTLRPVYLLREQETDAELLNLVIPSTDLVRNDLLQNGLYEFFGDICMHVKVNITDSMKELKLKKKICGLGGADCILCVTKQADWTDVTSIVQGFPINRSAEETWKLYEDLVNEDGEIETASRDFEIRKGLTKKPIQHHLNCP